MAINHRIDPGLAEIRLKRVEKGDAAYLEQYLKSGGDPNGELPDRPLLAAAVAGEHKKLVLILIDHGADINRFGDRGNNPLMAARRTGNLEIVRTLLDRGADPSCKIPPTHLKVIKERHSTYYGYPRDYLKAGAIIHRTRFLV